MVWRTHDAQYWGAPQRRRRISVVADLGGDTAAEIQFDSESLSGDIAAGGAPGEGFAEAAEAGASYAVRIRGGCDGGGKGALVQTEKSGTLGTGNDQTIFAPIPINDKATRWQGGGESRNHDGSGNGQAHEGAAMTEEVSQTLNTMHDAQAVMCPDVAHALRAKANCAYREDAETYVVQNMVVRRLTPMECERLQGFPDHWTDIGEWTDEKGKKHKAADSPRYKALGNSIALPFWGWMLRRMARYLPEDATLGSLFDGIAGFPLIWQRIHGKGTARWASEIEQFPIAVTKKWFGEE